MTDIPQALATLAGRQIVAVETPTEHFDTYDHQHAFTSFRIRLDDGSALTFRPDHAYKESHTQGCATVNVERRAEACENAAEAVQEFAQAIVQKIDDLKTEMRAFEPAANPNVFRPYEKRIAKLWQEARDYVPLAPGDGTSPSMMNLINNVRDAAAQAKKLQRHLMSDAYHRKLAR